MTDELNMLALARDVSDSGSLAILRRISEQLDALPGRIAAAIERQPRAPRRLSPADAAVFAKLLPAIHAGLPNVTFSVRLLHDYGALAAPQYVALRNALESAGGSRTIGHLLRRGAKSDIPGFKIEANGESSEGVLWSLTEVVILTIESQGNTHRRLSREPIEA
jgi:hypothetical protein